MRETTPPNAVIDLESTPVYGRVDSPYAAIDLESTPVYVRVDSPVRANSETYSSRLELWHAPKNLAIIIPNEGQSLSYDLI